MAKPTMRDFQRGAGVEMAEYLNGSPRFRRNLFRQRSYLSLLLTPCRPHRAGLFYLLFSFFPLRRRMYVPAAKNTHLTAWTAPSGQVRVTAARCRETAPMEHHHLSAAFVDGLRRSMTSQRVQLMENRVMHRLEVCRACV